MIKARQDKVATIDTAEKSNVDKNESPVRRKPKKVKKPDMAEPLSAKLRHPSLTD
jgi:hypothetical protein